jgi:2-hydroxychromene-2-carboxylate isomerase
VNINDRGELVRHLEAAGLEGSEILKKAEETEYATRLEANTQLATERCAFNSPTFIVGDDVFFGNDRLDFLEERLNNSPS